MDTITRRGQEPKIARLLRDAGNLKEARREVLKDIVDRDVVVAACGSTSAPARSPLSALARGR